MRYLGISDMFQLGSWALMHSLWAHLLRQRSFHEQVPGWYRPEGCCEAWVMAMLVYKLGVRQAPDAELAPTLPLASVYNATLVARHPWSHTGWWLSDVPRGAANCSVSNPYGLSAANEFCVPPGNDEVPLPAAARNHSETSVWQPAKPSVGRPEPELRDWLWRVGLAQSKVDWQQRLHPYVAPMYRLKSGMVLVEKGSPEGPPCEFTIFKPRDLNHHCTRNILPLHGRAPLTAR